MLYHFYNIKKCLFFDIIRNENNAKHNSKWRYIPDHLQRILVIGSSGPGTTYALLNLKEQKSGTPTTADKIYLYAKDLNEPKYQLLIKKCQNARIKYLNDLTTFIEYLNTINDGYDNIDIYNAK